MPRLPQSIDCIVRCISNLCSSFRYATNIQPHVTWQAIEPMIKYMLCVYDSVNSSKVPLMWAHNNHKMAWYTWSLWRNMSPYEKHKSLFVSNKRRQLIFAKFSTMVQMHPIIMHEEREPGPELLSDLEVVCITTIVLIIIWLMTSFSGETLFIL